MQKRNKRLELKMECSKERFVKLSRWRDARCRSNTRRKSVAPFTLQNNINSSTPALLHKCHSINNCLSLKPCHNTSSWSSTSLSKSPSWSGSSWSIPGDICWWMIVVDADFGSSSFHLSIDRLLAFMKKLPTVVGSSPSCLAIVTCISLDGLFVSWGQKLPHRFLQNYNSIQYIDVEIACQEFYDADIFNTLQKHLRFEEESILCKYIQTYD